MGRKVWKDSTGKAHETLTLSRGSFNMPSLRPTQARKEQKILVVVHVMSGLF